MTPLYDVFICHASEDKDDFVRPLSELLAQQHIEVWYDEFSLSIGDSLSQKIDEGLAKSKFGIVVLSPSFFKKPWAKRELKGLTAREIFEKQDIILPIWHRVGLDEVIKYSPPLADKKAISSSDGISAVMRQLVRRLKPHESPLVVARDFLNSLKVDPPAISDEWWLDIIEYKEELRFPDTNMGRWWIFPLPFPNEQRGRERGMNIASAALQMDWSFEAEELKISSLTDPADVHKFLRRWPGLLDCAKNNPGTLALYAPQLTIPGFDQDLEDVFDKLLNLPPNDREVDRAFTYGRHYTVNDSPPLCGDVIAFRHPQFGNYTAGELAYWYFETHDASYIRHGCEQFAGLVWLFSKSSGWMPETHRNILIQGINERDQWARELYNHHIDNPFFDSLFSKKQKQFKLTKTVKQGLLQIVDATKAELGITDSSDKIIARLFDIDIVNGFYTYQNWLNSKKK
jgi:hypothetical protein